MRAEIFDRMMLMAIATAWADGEMHPEENKILSKAIKKGPTAEESKQYLLESIAYAPASDYYCQILSELRDLQPSVEEANSVLQLIEEVSMADGEEHPREISSFCNIRDALETVTGPLS